MVESNNQGILILGGNLNKSLQPKDRFSKNNYTQKQKTVANITHDKEK